MPKTSTTRRVLMHYDFEDNSSVEIVATGAIDTPTAIRCASQLLKLKEEELGANGARRVTTLKATA